MISIIVPVYNCEEYIEKCIDSIVGQSYKDIEIILIDDGSTDNSGKLCDKKAKEDERIIVVHQTNAGQDLARKRGLEYSSGEYVTFIDGDDWISSDMFEKMLNYFVDENIDIVISNRYLAYTEKNIIEKNEYAEGIYNGKEIAENCLEKYVLFHYLIILSLYGKIYRKKLVYDIFKKIEVGINYGEDHIEVIASLLSSRKIYIVNKTFYYYRQHSDSIMHKINYDLCIESQKQVYQNLLNAVKNETNYEKMVYQIKLDVIHNLLLKGYDYFNDYTGIYPYQGSFYKNTEIVIYGAGMFGQMLFSSLKKRGYNVLFIVDDSWNTYQKKMGTSVRKVDALLQEGEVSILVAVLKSTLANEIVKKLEEKGIVKNNIYLPSINVFNSEYTETVLNKLNEKYFKTENVN